MDQSITQWVNSFAGSNAILDRIMIVASEFGVPTLIILVGLQWWSKRERRSGDWSFPSDHATASLAIATAFLFHHVWRRAFILLAGALLICVSRVYIGTHYASDVLGGAVTGIIAALVVRSLYWEGTWADRFITGLL